MHNHCFIFFYWLWKNFSCQFVKWRKKILFKIINKYLIFSVISTKPCQQILIPSFRLLLIIIFLSGYELSRNQIIFIKLNFRIQIEVNGEPQHWWEGWQYLLVRRTKNARRAPFYIISAGNAVLMITVIILHDICDNNPNCSSSFTKVSSYGTVPIIFLISYRLQ